MTPTYAKDTSVSVEKSRAEIETILGRYGAEQFGYATEPGRAQIMFSIKSDFGTRLMVRMNLVMPPKKDFETSPAGRKRNAPKAINVAWEQACRSLWRSLALVVKAKLETVAAQISTVEREFMADIVLPNGRTLGEETLPQLPKVYEKGGVPKLLLTGTTA